jgi:uncharacterized protein YdhG (YjbR/CyaY superfamily)
MPISRPKSKTVDEYIARFPSEVQEILQKVRRTIRSAAPQAEEVISYQIPAFKQNGVLIYFAAFKNHIGLYPPIKGDARLMKAVSAYAGPKGNLQFPFDQPIPYDLIKRIVRFRVKQTAAKPGYGASPRRTKARKTPGQ